MKTNPTSRSRRHQPPVCLPTFDPVQLQSELFTGWECNHQTGASPAWTDALGSARARRLPGSSPGMGTGVHTTQAQSAPVPTPRRHSRHRAGTVSTSAHAAQAQSAPRRRGESLAWAARPGTRGGIPQLRSHRSWWEEQGALRSCTR